MTPAYHQGWFDARAVHFTFDGTRPIECFDPRRAAGVYADPAESPRHVLDYVDGAWAWLSRFTNEKRPGWPGRLPSNRFPRAQTEGASC